MCCPLLAIVAPSISLSKICFALSQYMRQCPLFATELTVQVLPQERRVIHGSQKERNAVWLHSLPIWFALGQVPVHLSAFGSSSTALHKLFSSSWARISALSMLRSCFPVLSEIVQNGVFPMMSCSINELSPCSMAAWPPTYRQILLFLFQKWQLWGQTCLWLCPSWSPAFWTSGWLWVLETSRVSKTHLIWTCNTIIVRSSINLRSTGWMMPDTSTGPFAPVIGRFMLMI